MRWLSILVVVAVLAICAGAVAAASDREVYIYRGTPLTQSGITVGSWGSGKAAESADSAKVLTGNKSVKITTQGMYSGARIDFAQPVSLYTEGVEPNRYAVFTFYFDALTQVDPGAGTYSYDIEPYTIPKVGLMRFVFVSDSGVEVEAVEQTNPVDPDDNWCRIPVPLAKFKAAGGAPEFRLTRLLIFSDIPTTFYLGEIKLVTDDVPIKVDPLSSQVVAIGDELLFLAKATGGVSSLKYSWDYDSGDGIQTQDTGMVGRKTYTKGGDFTLTLIVSDADNIKEPVKVTATVTVND